MYCSRWANLRNGFSPTAVGLSQCSIWRPQTPNSPALQSEWKGIDSMDSSQKNPRELFALAWTESQANLCASLGSRMAQLEKPGHTCTSHCDQEEGGTDWVTANPSLWLSQKEGGAGTESCYTKTIAITYTDIIAKDWPASPPPHQFICWNPYPQCYTIWRQSL